MNGIFAPRTRISLRSLGAIEIPSWCASQPDFNACAEKQQSACDDDCNKWTDNPAADCVPKCRAAWTDIQCTPGCLAKQPTDPSPTAFLKKKVSVPVVLLAGLAIAAVAAVVLTRKKRATPNRKRRRARRNDVGPTGGWKYAHTSQVMRMSPFRKFSDKWNVFADRFLSARSKEIKAAIPDVWAQYQGGIITPCEVVGEYQDFLFNKYGFGTGT